MNTDAKRGCEVWFKWGHRWISGKLLQFYPEFHSAVKVEKDEQEYILRPEDVRSWGEHEAAKENTKLELTKLRYQQYIDAWNAGAITAEAMAEKTNRSVGQARIKIAACKRLGLIK